MWEQDGTLTPDVVASYFTDVCLEYLNMSLVGWILPYATASLPSYGLACDGATYNRVDYPLLYAALDAAFIVDANHFTVPDLRDRVIVGAGSAYAVNAAFGENTHTLLTSEMPAHNHTDLGHTHLDAGHVHTEIGAAPAAVTIGTGIPVPAGTVLPTVTGIGNASIQTGNANIQNTGGGGSHENRQPSRALKFCIVYQ